MIIRKPYAFLIKNFRKIHIFLLLLSLFVTYKLFDVSKFINNFMNVGIYDLYKDPVSKHISFWLNISIFLLIIGSVALLFLLLHKKKPWKLYLIPVIEYFLMFIILGMIKSFFANFTETVEVTNLRFSRDLLVFLMLGQIPAIGIYIMRIFGLDIKKFNFNSDQEFLELSDEDREEVEISLGVDINTFKRLYKRLVRNIGYIYKEHKLICRIIIVIICVVLVRSLFITIFVTNKTYRAGQVYNVDGFSITINDVYYTDKDYRGVVITKKSDFVIAEVTVKNNDSPRVLNTDYFHLRNGGKDYTSTHETYSKEFIDLGKCYKSVKELKRDEEINFIIVFKVDKNLSLNKYDMYYQELGDSNRLRKIKVNVKDISKIEKTKKLKMDDNFELKIGDVEDSISFDSYEFLDSVQYYVSKCTSLVCDRKENNYTAAEGYKVLKIHFGSISYEAKNMIDFFTKYGTIIYKDSDDTEYEYDVKIAIDSNYYGKDVYLVVPNEMTEAKKISLSFLIRNKSYLYTLE